MDKWQLLNGLEEMVDKSRTGVSILRRKEGMDPEYRLMRYHYQSPWYRSIEELLTKELAVQGKEAEDVNAG